MQGEETSQLEVSWPWWVRPGWVIVLLVGTTAGLAAIVDPSTYLLEWGTYKFFDSEAVTRLALGVGALLLGTAFMSGLARRGGRTTITFTETQLDYLRRAYLVTFQLTVVGYALWVGSALMQGVGFGDLAAVVGREGGAISSLKERSRPIGGLTTLTQFGPVAVVLGYLLRKLGRAKRGYWILVLLAAGRMMFYAERLALLEVLIPMLLVASLTVRPGDRWRRTLRAGPILAGPLLWAVFAASEYTRSWVYYQRISDAPFAEWVSTRLLGYYATSYNNSALFLDSHVAGSPPWFSLNALWNAPLLSTLMPAPLIGNMAPSDWWRSVLTSRSNPEFNNVGSFLTTHAEVGLVGSLVFWLIVGMILGRVFTNMTRGSLPALLALPTLFVGLLELPRFIYWTQGRATPLLLALVVISLTYPKADQVARRRRMPSTVTSLPNVSSASAPRRDSRR